MGFVFKKSIKVYEFRNLGWDVMFRSYTYWDLDFGFTFSSWGVFSLMCSLNRPLNVNTLPCTYKNTGLLQFQTLWDLIQMGYNPRSAPLTLT